MQGIIFAKLKDYTLFKLGDSGWDRATNEAGIAGEFEIARIYPDMEAITLIHTISKMTGQTVPNMLQEFGEFIVPDLLALYGSLLDKNWTTLDIIEHTEETIHRVIRVKNAGAAPPEINCSRRTQNEVNIRYSSKRRMCGMAKGIANGLAKHFGEKIQITERNCMLLGNSICDISVLKV